MKTRILYVYCCVSTLAFIALGLWSLKQIAISRRLLTATAYSMTCHELAQSTPRDGDYANKVAESCRSGSDDIVRWALEDLEKLIGSRDSIIYNPLNFFARRVVRQPDSTTLTADEIRELGELLERLSQ